MACQNTLMTTTRCSLRSPELNVSCPGLPRGLARPLLAYLLGLGTVALLLAGSAGAATITYDSNNTPYTGGTIAPGDTVLLNDGATVTGNITDNGTLQFNQSAGNTLTISNLISGTGMLSLTNTGTLNLTGTSAATNTVVLDMTTSAAAGRLQIRSGTGILRVGSSGTGTLSVNGGSVTNANGYLGYNAGSVGTATVSTGTWANSSTLYIGRSGTGTLNVNGGSVTNANGYLGLNAGSVGTATVSSGTWTNSSNFGVAQGGTGTLNVTGGYVSDSTGYIGTLANSSGTATVSSGTWANSGDLTVGTSGTGTLNVTGGSVTDANGYIGYNAGSVGTATVSSGTWANSGSLYVGRSGTGTLTMTGGVVSVGGTVSTGTASTINLNAGGTLQIGTGTTGGVLGVNSLTNNGTLIFNRSDDSAYAGIISGTGAVTKQGGGTLTLDGANSYSGVTTISGGVIAYGASNVLSDSTAVTVAGGGLDLGSYTDTVTSFTITSGTLFGSGKLTAATYALLGGTVAGNLGGGSLTVTANSNLNGTADVTSLRLNAGTLTLGSAGRPVHEQSDRPHGFLGRKPKPRRQRVSRVARRRIQHRAWLRHADHRQRQHQHDLCGYLEWLWRLREDRHRYLHALRQQFLHRCNRGRWRPTARQRATWQHNRRGKCQRPARRQWHDPGRRHRRFVGHPRTGKQPRCPDGGIALALGRLAHAHGDHGYVGESL